MPSTSLLSTILSLSLLSLSTLTGTSAQGNLDSNNNVTGLQGTWSTGSGHVSTGGNFCNPENSSFTYPTTTGISYSFTDTGFFEEAQYRYTANASNPSCIEGYVLWQHGKYVLNDNGSLTLYPYTDGLIQVQDPCAAVTNVIAVYEQITLYADWGITLDSIKQNYALGLTRFDGALMPPMYLIANPPNMLPTEVLTGVNATGQVTRRDLLKRSSAPSTSSYGKLALAVAGFASLVAGGVGVGML